MLFLSSWYYFLNYFSDFSNNFFVFFSCVLRCPREVSPFISSILSTAIAFMKYDPNYSYDEEEGEEEDEEEEEEEEGNTH